MHLLVNYPPKVAISRLVNSLKGAFTTALKGGALAHISVAPAVDAHEELP